MHWHWIDNDTTLKVRKLKFITKTIFTHIHFYWIVVARRRSLCVPLCVWGLTPVTRAHTFSAHTDKRNRPEPFDDNVHTDTQLWCGSERGVWCAYAWVVGFRFMAKHNAVSCCIMRFRMPEKERAWVHQKLTRMLPWKRLRTRCGVYTVKSFSSRSFYDKAVAITTNSGSKLQRRCTDFEFLGGSHETVAPRSYVRRSLYLSTLMGWYGGKDGDFQYMCVCVMRECWPASKPS